MPELAEVKNYLQITWNDEQNDRRLKGILERGKARLQEIAGAPLDFDTEGSAKALLLDYCRYANSQALEVFEQNFRAELLSLNLRKQVDKDGNQNADPV